MQIAYSKSISQPPCTVSGSRKSESEVEQIVQQLIEETGINSQGSQRMEDGTLQLKLNQDMKLHTLMLKAEKQGLNIRYVKQTVIEIC